MASRLTITSSLRGTLDGASYSPSESATLDITGYDVQTFDVDNFFSSTPTSLNGYLVAVLIQNIGNDEIRVRITRDPIAPRYQFFDVPSGACLQVFQDDPEYGGQSIYAIDVKAQNTTSRVRVVQAAL